MRIVFLTATLLALSLPGWPAVGKNIQAIRIQSESLGEERDVNILLPAGLRHFHPPLPGAVPAARFRRRSHHLVDADQSLRLRRRGIRSSS